MYRSRQMLQAVFSVAGAINDQEQLRTDDGDDLRR
jgi:hypothetical protein